MYQPGLGCPGRSSKGPAWASWFRLSCWLGLLTSTCGPGLAIPQVRTLV